VGIDALAPAPTIDPSDLIGICADTRQKHWRNAA
jgi:hypothetical protein